MEKQNILLNQCKRCIGLFPLLELRYYMKDIQTLRFYSFPEPYIQFMTASIRTPTKSNFSVSKYILTYLNIYIMYTLFSTVREKTVEEAEFLN